MKTLLLAPLKTSLPTQVFLGENLLLNLKEFCAKKPGKKLLVCETNLVDLYGKRFADAISAELIEIPSGEQGKTFETEQALMQKLFAKDAGKDTTLLALGGGATTDVVSFVASIYKRGLPLILIPTTLLAIVDASIGGKTAINTPFGKNLIGTFYHPEAIFADLSLLKSLSQKEWQNGFAEILKMGLIYDPSLCSPKGHDNLLAWVQRAIQAKIDVVTKDPTDCSVRKILNFGHTIGHALETLSQYALSHGEAVAIGSLAEAHLSLSLGYLSPVEFVHIQKLYASFSLKLPINYSRQALLDAISHDKKRSCSESRFVLIDRIGHAIPFNGQYCHALHQKDLVPTLDWMETKYG